MQAQTVIEGWQMGGQLDVALMPLKPKQLLLTAHGVMGDFTIDNQAVIDFQNPIQEQVTISTQYAGLDLSVAFAYSYTFLPEFTLTFGSATLGVSTTTAENVLLFVGTAVFSKSGWSKTLTVGRAFKSLAHYTQ